MPPAPRDDEDRTAAPSIAGPPSPRSPGAALTVVVPTYDRPQALARCLEALAAQTYPAREIVVVDDGGERALEPLLAGFDATPIRLVRQSNRGPAAARNAGVLAASSEFVALVDDDCEPSPQWLDRLAARLALDSQAMIGGRSVNRLDHNLFSAASQAIVDHLYDYYNADAGHGGFVATNNVAVKRDELFAVGGLDGSFPHAAGEDRDLCRRWRESGRRIVLEPEALIFHAHRLGPRSFLRQHFDYGRGAFRFLSKLRQRTGRGERKPPSFYLRLVLRPLVGHRSLSGVAMAGLAAASQGAVAAGYLYERAASERRRSGRPAMLES